MSICYLHLGSNVGEKHTHLSNALLLLELAVGKILKKSRVYETEAWGNKNQDSFLNQAIKIETRFSPEQILVSIHHIEKKLGRKREIKWGPRIIDIDILFYDDLIVDSEDLVIPHPFINERNFVLEPLAEIAPEFVHPITRKTVKDHFESCLDHKKVKLSSN